MVKEISFHIVKFSYWYCKTIYDDNQFICHCKCKTIANLGSFRILLPFFPTSLGVGVLNSAIFKLIRMLEYFFPTSLGVGVLNSAIFKLIRMLE